MITKDMLPPRDLEAEDAVISSLLVDGMAIININCDLQPSDFYSERNMCIYEACQTLYKRNEPINQVTVAQELSRNRRLDICGGAAYLSHLVSICMSPLDIDSYANIVYEMALRRKLIITGGQIESLGYESKEDIKTVLDKAEDLVWHLKDNKSNTDFVHIKDGLNKLFEAQSDDSDGVVKDRIKTGFTSLDELLGGFYDTDMIILAGRPGMGKTSVALNIARNAAIQYNAGVAIFSIEMAFNLLLIRMLANESGLPINVNTGLNLQNLSNESERQLIESVGTLSEANIWIDDNPSQQVIDIRSKLKRLSHKTNIDLVIIDHIGLLTSGSRFINRAEEVGYISKQLKTINREFKVPILALSQLNRGNESRSDKRPQLSDLRESGEIEQNADGVIFIYRDEYYYPTKEAWINANPDKSYPPPSELILSKNRNGATGTVLLSYEPSLYRFRSIANEEYLNG
jgi:replicative DNA helicase